MGQTLTMPGGPTVVRLAVFPYAVFVGAVNESSCASMGQPIPTDSKRDPPGHPRPG